MIKRILILTMAWTLSGMTGLLGAKFYVRDLVAASAGAVQMFLPAIIFVIAVYGESVLVDWSYAGNDGWTRVVWGSYGDGYIMSRFLVGEKPAPYNPQPQPQPQPAEEETDIRAYSSVKMLNTIVQNARFVEPYNITVTPTRASGWVYLRWFPSRNAKELATYGDGKTLRVISELKDWYQVEDPDTGKTGFLYKSYVNK